MKRMRMVTAGLAAACGVSGMMTVVLAATYVAGAVQAPQEYNIRYKHPKPGEPVVMQITNDVVGTMSFGLGTQSMTQKTRQWIKTECMGIDPDGIAKVRMTFERFAMDMNVGPVHMTFDSADEPAPDPTSQPSGKSPTPLTMAQTMVKAMTKAMVGHTLTATIGPDGKCLKMEGMKEMFDRMFKDMPGGEQFAKPFKEVFSEDSFKDQFFGSLSWLPTKPVRIGDVWNTEQRIKMGPMGETVLKGKNKLLSVETIDGRRTARVGVTMNMEMGNGADGFKVAGRTVKTKMTSTGGTGTWLWDLDRSRMIKLQQTYPMEMTTETGTSSQPGESFTMTQKVNYATTVELVGDELAARLLPDATPKVPAVQQPKAVPVVGTATQPAPTD
jgi:hypothetical protein